MRVLTVIALLTILIPQEINYPPELPPIPSPEIYLRALGWPIAEDEPIPHTEGDVVTADVMVVLASGVLPGNCSAISRINTTAINSGVATAQVRLVDCMVTNYVSSGDANTDLSRIRLQADGFVDEVHARRNSVFADTVIFLTKSPNACGVAYILSGVDYAFAVVNDGCISNSSLEHEWFHNVGLAHDQPNAGGFSPPNSYGMCILAGIFRCVMTYPSPCGGNRVAHISNPDILYQGNPTGSAISNGAKILRDRIAVIANFKNNPLGSTNHLR